jgi:hypothetical protein
VKQKFVRSARARPEEQQPDEEEKARLLLGKQVMDMVKVTSLWQAGSGLSGSSVRASRRFLPLKKL